MRLMTLWIIALMLFAFATILVMNLPNYIKDNAQIDVWVILLIYLPVILLSVYALKRSLS